MKPNQSRTVVLLGVGHTNADVVRRWVDDPIDDCRLVCVSAWPESTYSGMLPGTLAGDFPPDQYRIDLSRLTARAGASLVLADASGLDLAGGRLLFSDRQPIAFDALSIGVGSMPADWRRVQDHAAVVPIKPMQSFQSRLNRRLRETESLSRRRIAIVGGGVAGVEIAFCLASRLTRSRGSDADPMTIYCGGDEIAGGMRPQSIRRLRRLLHRHRIDVLTDCRVDEIGPDADGGVRLITAGHATHAADLVIWATGASPPTVLQRLNLTTDDKGFIATHRTLQSIDDPRVFAVGDCGTVMQSPSPKAGVYAVRQSPVLWHNLKCLLDPKGDGPAAMRPFVPQSDFLKLINTGDGRALLEYRGLTLHARWCWYLKTWIDQRYLSTIRR